MCSLLLAVLLAAPPQAPSQPPPPTLGEKLTELAKSLSCLGPEAVIWGRLEGVSSSPGDGRRLWASLMYRPAASTPVDEAIPYLRHQDPRVRTLAATFILFHGEMGHHLHLTPLLEDPALTFPRPPGVLDINPVAPDLQSVQGFMTRIIWSLMKHCAPNWRKRTDSLSQAFEEHFRQCADEPPRAGWFSWRMQQAAGGSFPPDPNRKWRVMDVLRDVDRRPPVERDLTRLALFEIHSLEAFVDERHFVYAARRLGPERLMATLSGLPPTKDPDLYPRRSGTRFHPAICRFVLRHASELLRPQDVEALEDLGHWVEAAELAPTRAAEILRRGQDAGTSPRPPWGRLTAAMWRLAGETEGPWVAERFFSETTGIKLSDHRLVSLLTDRWTPGDKRLLSELVKDERFESVHHSLLQSTARRVGANLLEPAWTNDLDRLEASELLAQLRASSASW